MWIQFPDKDLLNFNLLRKYMSCGEMNEIK